MQFGETADYKSALRPSTPPRKIFCANFFAAVCFAVAPICNLPWRRIAFGWAPGAAKSFDPVAASGLQIRDIL